MNTFDKKQLVKYSGCGNTFFILPIDTEEEFFSFQKNQQQLNQLAKLGKQHTIDSVMVLVGNPNAYAQQGYHVGMYVFEPHAYDMDHPQKAWSTMCGNGIRAAAQYLFDTGVEKTQLYIRSLAGIHCIEKQDNVWRVNMGQFCHNRSDLSAYVRPSASLSTKDFDISSKKVQPTISVGFHFHDSQKKDGEPHTVVFTKKVHSLFFIKYLAKKFGKKITHAKDVFPHEINTNVASIVSMNEQEKIMRVRAATYERNIYYVTKACGTGSTVIASLLFEQHKLSSDWKIEVQVPGGVLSIEQDDKKNYYLTGPVTYLGKIFC